MKAKLCSGRLFNALPTNMAQLADALRAKREGRRGEYGPRRRPGD